MADEYLGFASLAVITISLVLWFRAMYQVAIPRNRAVYIISWALAAALGMAALPGDPGKLAGVFAGISSFISLFILVTVAIGGQKTGAHAIEVGQNIPHFTALDEHKQTFDSQTLSGRLVNLLKDIKNMDWAPLCYRIEIWP